MNYEEAVAYIHSTYKFGSKLGLENIRYLLHLMDDPQKSLKVIHVAGTNGKGSTCAFISSVLCEQGYKVGLYTSPYLEEFTERIRVNEECISKKELAEVTQYVKEKANQMIRNGMPHPTEFEIVTAIGFEYFKRRKVDFLVLEVGLGGRGDSTNVIENPLACVITAIDFDHVDYLGNTLSQIAYEKAGIIKPNSYVVSYPQRKEASKVLEAVCRQRKAKWIEAPVDTLKIIKYDDTGLSFHMHYNGIKIDHIEIKMLGEHQARNAIVAITVLKVLMKEHHVKISKEAFYNGLKKTIWPGRLEIISRNPVVLIDGAHNVQGIKALSKTLKQLFPRRSIILGIGILGDKDVDGMLDEIIPLAKQLVLTEPDNPRALPVEKLAEKIKKYEKPFMIRKEIRDAVQATLLLAEKEEMAVFCGSLYMIGKVRTILKRKG